MSDLKELLHCSDFRATNLFMSSVAPLGGTKACRRECCFPVAGRPLSWPCPPTRLPGFSQAGKREIRVNLLCDLYLQTFTPALQRSSLPQLQLTRPVPTIRPGGQGLPLRVAESGPNCPRTPHWGSRGQGFLEDRGGAGPPRSPPLRSGERGGRRGRFPCFQYLPSHPHHYTRSSREKEPDPSPLLYLQASPINWQIQVR